MRHARDDMKLKVKAEGIRESITRLNHINSEDFVIPQDVIAVSAYRLGAVQAIARELAIRIEGLLEYLEK